jgi:hypothetical protein
MKKLLKTCRNIKYKIRGKNIKFLHIHTPFFVKNYQRSMILNQCVL